MGFAMSDGWSQRWCSTRLYMNILVYQLHIVLICLNLLVFIKLHMKKMIQNWYEEWKAEPESPLVQRLEWPEQSYFNRTPTPASRTQNAPMMSTLKEELRGARQVDTWDWRSKILHTPSCLPTICMYINIHINNIVYLNYFTWKFHVKYTLNQS